MEFEFDKEMDALLRQAAQSETAFAVNNPKPKIQNPKLLHLDADDISLFAENALPKKLRGNAVAHFADCDRCRRILSGLIRENSENEIVSAKQTDIFTPVIPWYRKLFAFPNLAYTLGALMVVFSGLVAFTVLRSVDNSKNSEVSQVSERQTGGKGMSSDGEAVIIENEPSQTAAPNSMPNAAMSNLMSNAAMSNSASSSNSMMSNASANSAPRSFNANMASNTSAISNKSSVPANTSSKEEARAEAEVAGKSPSELPPQSRTIQNLTTERRERDKDEKKAEETTDVTKPAPTSPPKPTGNAVSVDGADRSDSLSASAKKKEVQVQSVKTTDIGGKTFKRAGNAWVDSNYKGQATTNITRGTKEYKKLDSGLRVIAENLGGTVIIVWKDKAYRIQ